MSLLTITNDKQIALMSNVSFKHQALSLYHTRESSSIYHIETLLLATHSFKVDFLFCKDARYSTLLSYDYDKLMPEYLSHAMQQLSIATNYIEGCRRLQLFTDSEIWLDDQKGMHESCLPGKPRKTDSTPRKYHGPPDSCFLGCALPPDYFLGNPGGFASWISFSVSMGKSCTTWTLLNSSMG